MKQIDINDVNELLNLTESLKEVAVSLGEDLLKSAQAKAEIDRLLALKIEGLLAKKKNIGIEMALIMMMKEDPSIFIKYEEMLRLEAACKGGEVLRSALESQITMIQSLLKHVKQQGG